MLLRLTTYLGLVVRRLWAKRGILLGSFLGATLVTALLVIVPLYDASVAAIDLLFTVRNAPAADVDVASRLTTTAYEADQAAAARASVVTAEERLRPWYAPAEERTSSREFLFIPTGGAVDWEALAFEWQAEVERLVTEAQATGTLDELELPTAPWPTPPQEATQSRIVSAPDIVDRWEVIAGEWPGTDADLAGSGRLRIAIGEDLARLTGLAPGDTSIIRPFAGGPDQFEVIEVAAVARATDPGSVFWGVTAPNGLIYVPQETFDVWSGLRSRVADTDPWLRETKGFSGVDATQRWFMAFDRDSLDLEGIDPVRSAINNYSADVARDLGIATDTNLPLLLDRFDTRSAVFAGPILAMLTLIVGGALYFLIYTAALTLEREAPEMALLRTRGASSWQTVGIHLAQSALIAVLAAFLAPLVARFLVGLTGRVPPLSDLTGGEPLEVAQTQSLAPFIVAGAVLTFVTMGLAVLPFARRSVLELRSLAARPTRVSVWQRYYIDVFLVILAAVLLVQLAQAGFIVIEDGEARLNTLAIVAPALFLLAGALLLLRVLPFLLRFVGWLMTKLPGLAMSLPGWHLGRNPIPYGRLALLVWLTTGFGAFALTYAFTLEASFQDRAEYAAGADVRMVAPGIGFVDAPETIDTAAVFRSTGAPRLSSRRAELLAVRPDDFAQVVKWRGDFGADTAAELLGNLRPDGAPPDVGVELAATSAIAVDGIVVPRPWAEQETLGDNAPDTSLRLLIRVFDANGLPWTLAADQSFTDTEWRTVRIPLTTTSSVVDRPDGEIPAPVTMVAMWLELDQPAGTTTLRQSRVLVQDWRAETAGGEANLGSEIAAELTATAGLEIRSGDRAPDADFAVEEYYSELPPGATPPSAQELATSPLAAAGEVDMWVLPTRTRLASVPHLAKAPEPIRVLLDREAAAIAGLSVGSEAAFGVDTLSIPGVMAGLVDLVPTMVSRSTQGAMVIDLDAFNHWVNTTPTWSFATTPARPLLPDEIWANATDSDAVARQLAATYGDEIEQTVTVRSVAADFSSRPVQVGLVAILFVGALTGVILALAGVTGYVLLAVARRAREMGVLRALGFGRSGVASTFAVEQLAVLGLGAIVGVSAGIGLMWLMIPFLQLGETADEIIPKVLLEIEPAMLAGYVAVVGALLIASVVWATRRVSATRMSEVLREVER